MKLVLGLLLIVLSVGTRADWVLNNDESSINFISIKKSIVGEVHNFKVLSGTLADNKAVISIDLSSVETNISIRNARMQALFFEVVKFPSAIITSKIDTARLLAMKAGDNYRKDITFSLTLHGATKEIISSVYITKLSNGRVAVQSEYPVIIKTGDFALNKGLEALRGVAKLSHISSAVPVTFRLIFTQ